MEKEITVRVHCGWGGKVSLHRQTPNQSGVWENFRFYFDEESEGEPLKECDYLIVFNEVLGKLKCKCPKGNVWLISCEPPTSMHEYFIWGYHQFDRLFTQHPEGSGIDSTLSQGAIPWHVKKSYDELLTLPDNRENKTDTLCTITSNLNYLPGHIDRLNLLRDFQSSNFPIDFFGRGHTPLPNDSKFEVLYPRKYSVAIENSYYDSYWTEKIADCFLSWTMPIYAGAPNITDFFPKEAMILIDPKNPEEAKEIIQSAIANKVWEKNLDAIKTAREKVLQEYQFFPFIVKHIREHIDYSETKPKRPVTLKSPYAFRKKTPRIFLEQILYVVKDKFIRNAE